MNTLYKVRCSLPWIALGMIVIHANDGVAADRPPNIVFILADDLGIMDVNAYATHLSDTTREDRFYETPHIDALVGKGIAFSQAYANQLCSPTRAAILTGVYASKLGVTTATPRTKTYYNQGMEPPSGYSPHDAFAHKDAIKGQLAWGNAHSNTAVSPQLPTLPKVLATHDCAYLGKWHLGGHGAKGRQPRDHGFAEIAYYDAGGSPYFNWRRRWDQRKLPYPTMPQDEWMIGTSGNSSGKEYLTEDLTIQANRYLKQRAQVPDRPFFLYFAHFSVHTPLQAQQDAIDYFDSRPQKGAGGQDNAIYAAMVKHLDDSVGSVIATLKETGLDKNTVVVFSSDNGGVEYTNPPATDNFPFKGGKACLYEGGVRVPLVVYQKGKYDQRTWCDTPVNCIDFLPTFAALTGNSIPDSIDGQSLLGLLERPHAQTPPRTFYWHYPFNVIVKHPDNGFPLAPHSAIRVGDYKLIWDWHGTVELYNIPVDPFEQNDLAKSQPARTERLLGQLKVWLRNNVKAQYFPRLNPAYDADLDQRGPMVNLWADHP